MWAGALESAHALPCADVSLPAAELTAAPCPPVPSGSFCYYAWNEADGTFAPTRFSVANGELYSKASSPGS
jgi:hypothetical protein